MKHSFCHLALAAVLYSAGVTVAEADTFNLGNKWQGSYDEAVSGMGTNLPYQLDEPQSSSQMLIPASLLSEIAPKNEANSQTITKINSISVQFCAQDVYGEMEGNGDFEVWIENTSATDFNMNGTERQWFEYSNGTHGILSVEAAELGIEYYEPFTLTITLDQPFEYTGENLLLTFKGTCDFTESFGMEWYAGAFTFSPKLGVLSGMATDHKMSGKLTNTQSTLPYMRFAYETETTQTVAPQPVRNPFAYNVKGTLVEGKQYEITFKSNGTSEAFLVLTDAEGQAVQQISLGKAQKGENSYIIDLSELTVGTYTWAIRLESENEYTEPTFVVKDIFDATAEGHNFARGGVVTINDYEYDSFGYTLVGAGRATGIAIYTPEGELVTTLKGDLSPASANNLPMRGGERFGKAVFPSWGDATSGYYYVDPLNPSETLDNILVGDRASSGLFTYNGVQTAGGSPCVAFLGEGEDQTMWLYEEDLFNNDVALYPIGTAERLTVAGHTIGLQNATASQNLSFTPTKYGMFIAQNRGNLYDSSVPALLFVSAEGKKLATASDFIAEGAPIANCNGGFAISSDLSLIAICGYTKIAFFSLEWEENEEGYMVPSATKPLYTVDCALAKDLNNGQAMFDAGNNLHYYAAATTNYAIGVRYAVITLPGQNVATTPAKSSNAIIIAAEETPDPTETTQYTIEFATAQNNNSTTVELSSAIANGSEYVTDLTYSNSGVGVYGLKVGQNKNPGYVTLNLANEAKVKPTSITMQVSANKNADGLVFEFNGTAYPLSANAINGEYDTIEITDYAEVLENLTFTRAESSKEGFIFVKSITVSYSNEETPDPIIPDEPETPMVYVANGEEATVAIASGMMAGIQFDVELPDGVSFSLTSPNATEMSFQEKAISDNIVRYIAYTNNGETIDTEFSGVIAATNAQRSAVVISNIILSVNDEPVNQEEVSVPVLGYGLTGYTLPDVNVGDVVALPAPIELPYSEVSFSWKEYDSEYAQVDANGVLTALREGTIDNLAVEINDPLVANPILTYASLNIIGKMGDVDGSGTIDIADVICVVNYILMNTPENFIFKYADLDNSGDINIADVTRLIKLVLAQPKLSASARAAYRAQAVDSEFTVSGRNAEVSNDGKMHVFISINKQRAEYAGLQLDLELNNALSIESVKYGNSNSDHVLRYASVDENTTRLIIYSPSNTVLPVGEEIVDITLADKFVPVGSNMTICSAISADPEGEAYFHPQTVNAFDGIISGVSAISSEATSVRTEGNAIIVEAPADSVVKVHDISGRLVGYWTGNGSVNVAEGIYIVSGTGIKAQKVEVK